MKKASLLTLIIIICFAQSAAAQISVSSVMVHFKFGERPVQNLVVKNSSPDVLYVTVSVEELLEPFSEQSPRAPTESLIISPKRFSIDGANERVIRMLNKLPPGDKERVFRVAFVPQDRGFAESVERSTQGRQTVLKVLTGMGVLVFVDPAAPKGLLKWERAGGRLRFWNEGNRHVRVMEGKACGTDGANCTPLASRRVYAGREHVVEVPDDKTVTYTRREGPSGEYETLVIPQN